MKKGFTLIELLAVIVLLAIIAIIATPIVINVIDDSKEAATLRSAEFYLDAVELSLANTSSNNTISNGQYNIKNGNICLEYDEDNNCKNEFKIEAKGDMPQTGKIVIENNQVAEISMNFQNKVIGKFRDSKLGYVDNEKYKAGTPVYFNVTTGKTCEESEVSNKLKEGCMKFYITKDLGGAVNLILDHNTTYTIEWINQEDYNDNINWEAGYMSSKGPITALKQLKLDTENWKGTLEPVDYILDGIYNKVYYQINYNDYNARLVTANEIAEIVGKEGFSDLDSAFYFDSLLTSKSETCKSGNITGCKYGWLYDNLKQCKQFGCYKAIDTYVTGYWTSTAFSGVKNHTWVIYREGNLRYGNSSSNSSFGIRPLITIAKDKLKNTTI